MQQRICWGQEMRKESTVLNTNLWDILPIKTHRSIFFSCVAPILTRPGRLSQNEEGNYREQVDARSTLKSRAWRFTYFHSFSRGSQIRNNQNPAGNNIRHLNWVGSTTDVSNVSLSRSFSDCFFSPLILKIAALSWFTFSTSPLLQTR